MSRLQIIKCLSRKKTKLKNVTSVVSIRFLGEDVCVSVPTSLVSILKGEDTGFRKVLVTIYNS